MLLKQILMPFGYLAIRHPHKWVVDWFYPALATLLTLLGLLYATDVSLLLAKGGMVSSLLSFVQSLPGFYIAALAAIATFGRADIDSVLPEPTPEVKVKFIGGENIVKLTRRRFLAMLFSFLTAESIVLIIFSIFAIELSSSLSLFSAYGVSVGSWISLLLLALFFFTFFQLVAATFWGLYYLGFKLHE